MHFVLAVSSFDAGTARDHDDHMVRRASVDERALRRSRSQISRRTTLWHQRPRRGVSAAELDALRIHADLFAAVVALERRIEAAAIEQDGARHAISSDRFGLHPAADPWMPFDASHWLARNPWYEA